MQKIASFTVDHTVLTPGIYVSRVDGDCVTYDLRMRTPNAGDYLSDLAMHSFEHMLATYMRSGSAAARVVYVGPMGCRTGFYLIMRGSTEDNKANFAALKEALRGIVSHRGKMPGAAKKECGNYRCLSTEAARKEAEAYLAVLEAGGEPTFRYREK